ncbi:MAG: hypothetical protein ABL949_10330 [Fimbriimonadaceae bacterium]
MNPKPTNWPDLPSDNPIPLLNRQKLTAENILAARVSLEKGCVVARHQHVSEQVALQLSGHTRWQVGPDGEEETFDMVGEQVLHLPSNLRHGVVALEDTVILDILSPPGAMGVDSQES